MGNFTAQFTTRSTIRIHERPVIQDQADSIWLDWPALHVAVVLFDQQVTLNETRVPYGLMAHVQVEAESIEEATRVARNVAVATMSICTCVTRGAIESPRIQWIYDATAGATERDLHHFAYDPYLSMVTRKADRDRLLTWLEKLFYDLEKRKELAPDRKRRLWQAITSFRRGLADNDDVLTEFLIQWSLLEMLDVVYREAFEIEAQRIYTRCPKCETEYRHCESCDRKNIHRRRQELSGVKTAFEALDSEDEFHELSRLRNEIVHGYKNIDECVATAKQHIELARTAVLTMIMQMLRVEDDVRKAVQNLASIKGKFEPYVKFKARGRFEPHDINSVHGHPGLEQTSHEVETLTSDGGRKLHVSPRWRFTARNVDQLTVSGYEIWGEKGRGESIEIAPIEAQVIKKSEGPEDDLD